MNTLDIINNRGLGNGWHAQELFKMSIKNGETMSEMFNRSIVNSLAFSVPATAIKITSRWITYQFLDGSISKFVNQNSERILK